MEEKRSTEMCTCPFCGQIHMAEVDNPGDPKVCEAAASMMCDCVGATNWRNRKRAIEDTQRQIEETFGPQEGEEKGPVGQEAIALLQSLVPGICMGHIQEAKIKLTPNITAKIGRARNGNMVVESKTVSSVKDEVVALGLEG